MVSTLLMLLLFVCLFFFTLFPTTTPFLHLENHVGGLSFLISLITKKTHLDFFAKSFESIKFFILQMVSNFE